MRTYTYIYNIDMCTIGWSPLLPLSKTPGAKFQFEALAVQIIIVVVHTLATCDSCAAQFVKERSRQFMSLTQQVKDSCRAV